MIIPRIQIVILHAPLPLASACELLPCSVVELLLLFSETELFRLLAIARCHSGILTAAAVMPLLNGELRPALGKLAAWGVDGDPLAGFWSVWIVALLFSTAAPLLFSLDVGTGVDGAAAKGVLDAAA